MKPFPTTGALLASAALLCSPVLSAPKSPSTSLSAEEAKARELVQTLGNTRYKVREDAARQLLQMGRLAKNALLEGKHHSDPEIWNRCSQLLPQALEQDLKVRIEAFVADKDGKLEHDLPFWNRYQKLAGNDAPARNFFAEMLKANANLLDESEESPGIAGDKYNVRAAELQYQLNFGWRQGRPNQILVHDVACLFLIGSDAETSKSITSNPFNPVGNFLWQQNIQNVLRGGEQSIPFRKLFIAWAEQRDDVNSVSQVLSMVQNLNMKEGLPFAMKAMQMKEQQVWTRAQAATCVGKMGDKNQSTAFDALFTDTAQVGNLQWNGVPITTNMSDVALAMALKVSGVDPKTYGFDALQNQPNLITAYHYLGFSTEAKRSAALIKAAGTKELPPSTRGAALLALGLYGKVEDLKALEPMLKETLVVAEAAVDGKKVNVELRDLALAANLQIMKLDLEEYGYRVASKDKQKEAVAKDFYLGGDEKRESAQKKWRQLLESQKKK